jgi:hypothetical protein
LDYSTHYYWKVIAKDEHNATTIGPTWDFMTACGLDWHEVGVGSAQGGGISQSDSSASGSSLAIAPDGTPYIAWGDYGEIYVRRWNGSSWEEVGVGSATDGGISDNGPSSHSPVVAVAPDGTPYVAWEDYADGAREVYVRYWSGSSWQEVGVGSASGGRISDNATKSALVSMAIAPDGTPYVAWQDGDITESNIYMRHWNGNSWAEVGAGSATGGGISGQFTHLWGEHPSVAIAPEGTVYVAWNGFNFIAVSAWNGDSWQSVDYGVDKDDYISFDPSMAIAPDSSPYVAWASLSDGDYDIYVRRWNGSSWEEVGVGSATGGGISDNSGQSWYPSVAIDLFGTPYVAWHDDSGANNEVYVRRWNGSSWEEVGVGSATGGGISDNSGQSTYPAIATAPSGTPYVAWDDDSSGDEIYVRRWSDQCFLSVVDGSSTKTEAGEVLTLDRD